MQEKIWFIAIVLDLGGNMEKNLIHTGVYEIVVYDKDDIGISKYGIPINYEKVEISENLLNEFYDFCRRKDLKIYYCAEIIEQ